MFSVWLSELSCSYLRILLRRGCWDNKSTHAIVLASYLYVHQLSVPHRSVMHWCIVHPCDIVHHCPRSRVSRKKIAFFTSYLNCTYHPRSSPSYLLGPKTNLRSQIFGTQNSKRMGRAKSLMMCLGVCFHTVHDRQRGRTDRKNWSTAAYRTYTIYSAL